jgi:dephospho-CoA kinase
MIIGITGTDGAGKGTVVAYLVKRYGYTHYSSRDLIVAEIERQGLPVDRNQMRLTANALRAEYGNAVIVEKALEKASAEGKQRIVIESIRALDEAVFLTNAGGILLAVDADPHVRYERVQARRSASDQVTFEQFLAHEALEKNDPDPHGMQKAKVMERADYVINNTTTVAELEVAVDQFLEQIQG